MNEIIQSRKPPVATTGILGWLRMNLFSNWINSLISLLNSKQSDEIWSKREDLPVGLASMGAYKMDISLPIIMS